MEYVAAVVGVGGAVGVDCAQHGWHARVYVADTRTYLEFVADQRLMQLGLPRRFNVKNPFGFMELQDVQELTNFFERTVAAYQVGVEGDVNFDEDF